MLSKLYAKWMYAWETALTTRPQLSVALCSPQNGVLTKFNPPNPLAW
jgi:hypothetical protein